MISIWKNVLIWMCLILILTLMIPIGTYDFGMKIHAFDMKCRKNKYDNILFWHVNINLWYEMYDFDMKNVLFWYDNVWCWYEKCKYINMKNIISFILLCMILVCQCMLLVWKMYNLVVKIMISISKYMILKWK